MRRAGPSSCARRRSAGLAAALAGCMALAVGSPAFAEPATSTATATRAASPGAEARRAAEEARVAELERQMSEYAPELKDKNGTRTLRDDAGASLATMLVQMVVVLGAVALLAYVLLGKGLPKLLKVEQPLASRRLLQVMDRLMIDQRRAIMVMKMGDAYFLVGSTEHGINLLSRLDPGEVEAALASTRDGARDPRAGGLAALLGRRPSKEG
jgi:flagellar biogenesis protein FliO